MEINYQQYLSGTVVTGIGTGLNLTPIPSPGRMLAFGTWPSSLRPTFGVDPEGMASSGTFLLSASAPFESLPVDNTYSRVITKGDLNDSDTLTLLDITLFIMSFNLPYNPAADMNSNGALTAIDRGQFVSTLASRTVSVLSPAPEPTGSELGVVYFAGDIGPEATTETGILEIRIDLDTMDSFLNGGIDLAIRVGSPEVIEFKSAEVFGTWTLAETIVDEYSVNLFAASVISGGLSEGAQGELFATIEYERIGPGSTPIYFEIGPESLVDGFPTGMDVTEKYVFLPSVIGPEPGDFDLDGDIDGQDFLAWQRNPSVGNLADWQMNYGDVAPLAASTSGVPEPSSLLLLALSFGIAIGQRRFG